MVPPKASKVYQDFTSVKFTLSQQSPIQFPVSNYTQLCCPTEHTRQGQKIYIHNNTRTAYQIGKDWTGS